MESTNLIKNLLIFTVGSGAGAFISVMVMKAKYEARFQEEVESMRSVIEKKEMNYEVETETDEYKIKDCRDRKIVVASKANYEKIAGIYAGELKGRDIDCDFQENIDPADLEHPMDDDEEIIKAEEAYRYDKLASDLAAVKPDEPYVIAAEQYHEERDYYDKETLYYYDEDEVLTDDQEEIITDEKAIVGEDSLLCFGDRSEDADIVFVRNERLTTDYEVIRLSESYQEKVLGMAPKGESKRFNRLMSERANADE